MSELKEIHDKVILISEDLSYLKGSLDTKLPTLATREDMAVAIKQHADECVLSQAGNPFAPVAKQTAKIVAAIGALTGAIYGLIQLMG